MSRNIFFLAIILIMSSCKKTGISDSAKKNILSAKGLSYLFYGSGNQLNVISSAAPNFIKELDNTYKHKYLLPYEQGAVDLNSTYYDKKQPLKKINANVIIDKRVYGNIFNTNTLNRFEKRLNKYLSKLNAGMQIQFSYNSSLQLPLGRLNTKGNINVDNIRDTLDKAKLLMDSALFHLVLLKDGDFLASAAALCLDSRGENLVLGDKLLMFPPLMLHEIFHGLGLKHSKGQSCGYPSNIMDFRSIGCSHHLLGRQVLMLHFNKYIPPVVSDVSFPRCDDCNDYQGSESIAEHFVNAIDNSVEGMPIAGDHAMMARYANEIQTGNMPSYIKAAIKANYKRQANLYGINDASDSYSNYCIEEHQKLRLRNLKYWVNYNLKQKGLSPQSDLNNEVVIGYLEQIKAYNNIILSDSNLILKSISGKPSPPKPDTSRDTINFAPLEFQENKN